MTYHLKYGITFFRNLLYLVGGITFLILSYPFHEEYKVGSMTLRVISPNSWWWDDLMLLMAIIVAVCVPISLYKVCLFSYFGISKKPVFTAGEDFIFDNVKNIKYYLDDIREIEASENLLAIYLYQPEKYRERLGNPSVKFSTGWKLLMSPGKTAYTINLDLLNIPFRQRDEFIQNLNKLGTTEAEYQEQLSIQNTPINLQPGTTIIYYVGFGRRFTPSLFLSLSVFYILIRPGLFDNVIINYTLKSIYALAGVYALYTVCISLYMVISEKPALTLNSEFAFDHIKNIKYYWEDINELKITPSSVKISLDKPEKYVIKTKSLPYRMRKLFGLSKKQSFSIDLDQVNINDYYRFTQQLTGLNTKEVE